MTNSIEVEIDENEKVRSLEPGKTIPTGKAILVWQDSVDTSAWKLSQKAFAADWERPEEDAAWAYLQPAK